MAWVLDIWNWLMQQPSKIAENTLWAVISAAVVTPLIGLGLAWWERNRASSAVSELYRDIGFALTGIIGHIEDMLVGQLAHLRYVYQAFAILFELQKLGSLSDLEEDQQARARADIKVVKDIRDFLTEAAFLKQMRQVLDDPEGIKEEFSKLKEKCERCAPLLRKSNAERLVHIMNWLDEIVEDIDLGVLHQTEFDEALFGLTLFRGRRRWVWTCDGLAMPPEVEASMKSMLGRENFGIFQSKKEMRLALKKNEDLLQEIYGVSYEINKVLRLHQT